MKKLEVTDVKKMSEEEKTKVKKKVEKMSEESKINADELIAKSAKDRLENAKAYDEQLQKEMLNVTQSFFNIGMILSKIQTNGYYRTLGYATIEEYAEERYNIKRANCYNLIAVYQLTKEFGAPIMREEYTKFEFSKLVALSRSKWAGDNLIKKVRPDNTVKQIENYVRYWNSYTAKHSKTPDYKSIEDWEKDNPELVQTSGQNQVEKDNPEKVQTTGQNESKEIKTDIEVVEVKEEPVTVSNKVKVYPANFKIAEDDNETLIKDKLLQLIYGYFVYNNLDCFIKGNLPRIDNISISKTLGETIFNFIIQK